MVFCFYHRRSSSKAQSSIRSQPSNTVSMSKAIQQTSFLCPLQFWLNNNPLFLDLLLEVIAY
ncbi:unnamed protein product [Arabidopsis halleri]